MRKAGAFPQPGEIQNGQGLFHATLYRCYFGVGTVSIRPSEWITVPVPLPLGTTIAWPPPGVVVVWYPGPPPVVTEGPPGVWMIWPLGLRPGGAAGGAA